MVPPRVAQKMSVVSVVSVESMALFGSRAKSGGTRPAARFGPPRGRGGDRGVARHRAQLAGPPRGAGGAGGGPGGPVGRMGGFRPGGWWVRLPGWGDPPPAGNGVLSGLAGAFAHKRGCPPVGSGGGASGGSKPLSLDHAPLVKMAARPQIPAALSPIADVTSLGCLHPARASGHEVRLFGT